MDGPSAGREPRAAECGLAPLAILHRANACRSTIEATAKRQSETRVLATVCKIARNDLRRGTIPNGPLDAALASLAPRAPFSPSHFFPALKMTRKQMMRPHSSCTEREAADRRAAEELLALSVPLGPRSSFVLSARLFSPSSLSLSCYCCCCCCCCCCCWQRPTTTTACCIQPQPVTVLTR